MNHSFKYTKKTVTSFFVCIISFAQAQIKPVAPRQMEYLNRGVYAINEGPGKVFVSWRLLGTEPTDLAFNVYRTTKGKTEKLNKAPLVKGTNFTDETADVSQLNTYTVRAIVTGNEQKSR